MTYNEAIFNTFEFGVVGTTLTLNDGSDGFAPHFVSKWEKDGEWCWVQHDADGDYQGPLPSAEAIALGLPGGDRTMTQGDDD